VQWDPSQPLSAGLVSGFDAVVHLAGESIVGRWTESKKRRIRESRVLGTRNLAEALAKASPRPSVLVCASRLDITEAAVMNYCGRRVPAAMTFLSEVCREWEAAAKPATDAGIRTLHTRFGLVLSRKGGALQKMLLPFRLGVGGRVGKRDAVVELGRSSGCDWGYVACAQKQSSGPVNFVAPNPRDQSGIHPCAGKCVGPADDFSRTCLRREVSVRADGG
jgi:uncharacterized protein (TIGR01777 family)